MSPGTDIVVIGGGVIGLSVAWHLAHAGATVTLLERGQVGKEASGAAAGMLAPLAEAHACGPFVELGLQSLQRYPAWVDALKNETGVDPELIGPGMLRVATSDADDAALRAAFAWQQAAGLCVEWLDGAAARKREPVLSPRIRSAVLSPHERQVEPRRLVRALVLACARRGVRIVEHVPAVGLETKGPCVTHVQTPTQTFPCAQVVVAGGAWTEPMGRWLHTSLPIVPVRGQIVALAGVPPPFRHTIYAREGYLVPKADGRILVGATEEHAGFDTRPTAGGMARLLALASMLVPALNAAPFDSVWAGLRPASRDGLPILGLLPGWENAHVAAGHFRNGVLLAPITGEIIAQSVLQQPPHALLAVLSADRFAGSSSP